MKKFSRRRFVGSSALVAAPGLQAQAPKPGLLITSAASPLAASLAAALTGDYQVRLTERSANQSAVPYVE
jgi:hypothetical protein